MTSALVWWCRVYVVCQTAYTWFYIPTGLRRDHRITGMCWMCWMCPPPPPHTPNILKDCLCSHIYSLLYTPECWAFETSIIAQILTHVQILITSILPWPLQNFSGQKVQVYNSFTSMTIQMQFNTLVLFYVVTACIHFLLFAFSLFKTLQKRSFKKNRSSPFKLSKET